MNTANPVSEFYTVVANMGATIEVRHRYLPSVNRFLFVVKVGSEGAAKGVVKSAQLLLKCPDPQHRYIKKDGIWRAFGVYRPLLQVPTKVKELDEAVT